MSKEQPRVNFIVNDGLNVDNIKHELKLMSLDEAKKARFKAQRNRASRQTIEVTVSPSETITDVKKFFSGHQGMISGEGNDRLKQPYRDRLEKARKLIENNGCPECGLNKICEICE